MSIKFFKMSEPQIIYELLCSNLQVPADSRIMKAMIDVSKCGELDIAGMSVTSQMCDILSKVLIQSKDICRLNVSDCLLPPQGLSLILATIHQTRIHTLQLKGNNIGGPAVYKLSRMLSLSKHIKNLGLEWNNLGLCSEGMAEFCSVLAANHNLEVLDLRNNQLDPQCAGLLAAALRKNTSLRALDLRWNAMEQAGGQSFLTALQTNKTLTILKLQGNSISNDLLTAIGHCVKHNSGMLRMHSEYEARRELLANHAKAVNNQRALELRQFAERTRRQIGEMDIEMKEIQRLLGTKQKEVEELESTLSETKRALEISQREVLTLQDELKLKDENQAAILRDYNLQLETVNKALIANKSAMCLLEEKLEEERKLKEDGERERRRDRDKIQKLEEDIERRKEELQTSLTEHVAAVEEERKQSQQRLALVVEEWSVRLEQKAAEHSRAEQVYRERLRAVEAALESAERSRAEQSSQWNTERAKWVEEKANIWSEAREKESCKVLLLTEKVDHLREDKSSLENQLSIANTTAQQLQRDNSIVVADLAELRRKLSAVQEELSSERLLTQKLRSEKSDDLRSLEAMRGDLASAQRAVSEAKERQNELHQEIRRLSRQIEDKEKQISSIRREEKDRAGVLVAAIKTYVEQLNLASS
ncbi:leucine-rich repeat-containing protein 45-like isoform X2 [Homalodisca vitripennis]|uniref:leucine-rich repeat-containing protein 45-like isoform X2 n=1 Tax=Homalodisca vitripennis TaxID=197043 RepID=UPI001EECD465|nr:leucine-rich repeat-containing protein 45-like isoform X2 [Homalodisca vitripennis]